MVGPVEGFGEAVGGEELEGEVHCRIEIDEMTGGDVEGFVFSGGGESDAEGFVAVEDVRAGERFTVGGMNG